MDQGFEKIKKQMEEELKDLKSKYTKIKKNREIELERKKKEIAEQFKNEEEKEETELKNLNMRLRGLEKEKDTLQRIGEDKKILERELLMQKEINHYSRKTNQKKDSLMRKSKKMSGEMRIMRCSKEKGIDCTETGTRCRRS